MYSSVPGFSCSLCCFWDLSIMPHVSIICSFLSLNTSPLCECTTIYSFSCWWTFELFPIFSIMNKNAIHILCQSLDGHVLSLLWGKLVEVKLLAFKINVFNSIKANANNCLNLLDYFIFSPYSMRVPVDLHPFQQLKFIVNLNSEFLMGMYW